VLGAGDMRREGKRDYAVFALGLLIGLVGRERVIVVVPEGLGSALPAGIVAPEPLVLADGPADTLGERLAPACAAIAQFVAARGPR
jgi:predicted nucleotide-binding protein